MTAECHKLIALSLGKIASSRRQRGGVNLRKNLMVAGVLFKARTIYMENYHTMEDTSSCVSESSDTESDNIEEPESDVEEVVCETNETAGNPSCEERVASLDSPIEPEIDQEDKENTPPNGNISTVCITTIPAEKRVDEVPDTQKDDSDAEVPCNKCCKRRLSDVELEVAVESISPPKRPKSEVVLTELKTKSDSETQTSEPMQTETTQISNLVNIFNSGFTGLLNTASDSCKNSSMLSVSSATDSQISCSTQIKEAFETLARPVLAMAV